jgi:hypothetical protein
MHAPAELLVRRGWSRCICGGPSGDIGVKVGIVESATASEQSEMFPDPRDAR